MKFLKLTIYILIIAAGLLLGAADFARADYAAESILASTDIADGTGAGWITGFTATSSIPASTTISFLFSVDGENWYNSRYEEGVWEPAADGTSAFDLRALKWATSTLATTTLKFYYKARLATDIATSAPVLYEIGFSYQSDYDGSLETDNGRFAEGALLSTDLLSGVANAAWITGFTATTSIPASTTISFLFSIDGENWYNGQSEEGVWESAANGTSSFDLRGLDWATSTLGTSSLSFYYKARLTTNIATTAPIIYEVSLDYADSYNADTAAAVYWHEAALVSADLLATTTLIAIERFGYNLTLPAGTSAYIQFGTTTDYWYSASGTLWATTTLASGNHLMYDDPLDLSGLGWSSGSFYYKVSLVGNGAERPVLADIMLNSPPSKTVANAPANSSNPPSLNEGLVGYWSFNGPDVDWASTTAEVLDRSGLGNNGNLIGAKAAIGVDGNQGMSFDGVDDYADIVGSFPVGNNQRTISLWFKAEAFEGNAMVGYEYDGNNGTDFMINAEEGNAVSVGFYGHSIITPIGELNTRTWYFATVVVPSGATLTSDVLVYINGSLQSLTETESEQTLNTTRSDVVIGRSVYGYFNGSIDEVKIYNRALSEAEIGELYQMGTRRMKINEPVTNYATTGLVGSWTFNGPDVAGTIAYDRSGSGNNGTISGAVPAIGKVGQGMSFDSNINYVDIPDIVEGLSQITLSAWVKARIASGNSTDYIIDQTSGPTDFGQITRDANEQFRCIIYNDNQTAQSVVSSAYQDTNWHHLACTYNGAEVDLFVDSQVVNSSNPLTGVTETTASDNLVISDTFATSDWDGLIDEVRIYNTALTPAEIQDLYEIGSRKVELRQ